MMESSFHGGGQMRLWGSKSGITCLFYVAGLLFIQMHEGRAQDAAKGNRPMHSIQSPRIPSLENVLPGPGPNLSDYPSSDSYKLGLGDVVGVIYSFRPTQPSEAQKVLPHDELGISYHFAMVRPGEP